MLKDAAEIQAFKCPFLPYWEAVRLGAGDQPWHCNTRLHNLNKGVASLLLHILQFDKPEFTMVSSYPVPHGVFWTGLVLGHTSPAEKREFTLATCVPAGTRTSLWQAMCGSQKILPVPKSLYCSPWISSYSWHIFLGNGVIFCLSQEPVGLWSSSESSITSNPPTTTICIFHGSPGSGLCRKQQGNQRNASPWKEEVGVKGKSFLKGHAKLRNHPSNLYSFLCWCSFPSAKKYIYIRPRFISNINPFTATVTQGINLARRV